MPLIDLIQKYASGLDEVLKAVDSKKITIFCIIMKRIANHRPNEVYEQSIASSFMVEEISNNLFSKHGKISVRCNTIEINNLQYTCRHLGVSNSVQKRLFFSLIGSLIKIYK